MDPHKAICSCAVAYGSQSNLWPRVCAVKYKTEQILKALYLNNRVNSLLHDFFF